MDFIARAGSIVDRGHRVIGVLVVIALLELFWVFSIYQEKSFLQERINIQNNTQSIYVVPNSQAGTYRPAEGALLLTTFVDYITQNLMTYTPANMLNRYKSVNGFFVDSIKKSADNAFKQEQHTAKLEEISSIFIADRSAGSIQNFKQIASDKYGRKTYEVIISGVRSFVIAGKVVESKQVSYLINLQETQVSDKNPFGFIVTNFKEQNKKGR